MKCMKYMLMNICILIFNDKIQNILIPILGISRKKQTHRYRETDWWFIEVGVEKGGQN